MLMNLLLMKGSMSKGGIWKKWLKVVRVFRKGLIKWLQGWWRVLRIWFMWFMDILFIQS